MSQECGGINKAEKILGLSSTRQMIDKRVIVFNDADMCKEVFRTGTFRAHQRNERKLNDRNSNLVPIGLCYACRAPKSCYGSNCEPSQRRRHSTCETAVCRADPVCRAELCRALSSSTAIFAHPLALSASVSSGLSLQSRRKRSSQLQTAHRLSPQQTNC